MDSVLVKFNGKNYYVKYDDLLNKAAKNLFAYEDRELTKNAKYRGGTLIFKKDDLEDKLRTGKNDFSDIKMPSRMPSNLATEDNNMPKINEMRSIGKRNIDKLKKIMHSMWAKNYNVTEDEIIEALPVEWWDTWESADAEIRRLVYDFLNKLKHARSIWDESNLKENKMTNEQKLRKYIREMIIEALKEGDPYGKPDEDKYLFKTGQDYLAGIQGEAITEVEGEAPSAEELAAQQKAAQEKAKKAAYQRFFSQSLAKFGVSSVNSLPDDKKKTFWDYVDTNWTSKQEAPVKTEGQWGNMPRHDSYFIDKKHGFDTIHKILNKLHGKPGIIDVSWSEGLISAEEGADLSKYLTPEEFKLVNTTDDWTDPAGGIHSFDDDDPAKMYESGALNELWKGKLQKNYDDDYEQFLEYDEMYGIAARLGFGSAEEAWEANPTIQVGVNPKDLKVIEETSSTGGVAGYETPRAFTGQKGISKKQKSIANQLGYELVDKSYAVKDQGDTQDLKEDMNKSQAYEKDLEWAKKNKQNPFYADIEDGTKYIWGTASGFAYSSPQRPEKEVENMWNIMKKNLNINESMDTFYLKDENLTPEQKLGKAMRQVRNNLSEIENVVKKSIALKNENNIGTENLGKRTYSSLKKIHETVTRLMVALNDMR